MRILLVDDNPTNRKLLRVNLEAAGYSTSEAGDGVEALVVLTREKTDAIISDILMPRMDGYRLCYEVRRDERFRNLPLIIYTNTFTSPGDEKFALELGADKFLRKPDGIKEILALLNDLSKLPRRVISPPPAELAVVKEYSELVVAKLEEKNAELLHRNEELRILRERLKSFFNAAPAGLCIIDSQLRYLQINETLAAINGLPPKDHLGRTIGEVVPDLAPTLELMLQNVLTTGTPVLNLQMSGELPSRPGILRHWVTSCFPLAGAGSQPDAVGVIVVEITDRKRAEERVSFQASLLDQVRNAVIATDVQGRIIYWNKFAEALYQWSPAEVLGKNIVEIIAPAGQKQLARKILAETSEKGFWEGEFLGQRKDGSTFPAQVFDSVIKDVRGNTIGFLGVSIDITERKQAEEIIKISERRFRQLAENINEVFWVTDVRQKTTLYVSPAYEKVWGRSCQSAYDSPKSWIESIHPEDRKRVLKAEAQQIETEGHDHTYRILRPDGSIRWIHDRAFPVRNEAGEVYRMVGVADDITDRKRAEETLRESEERFTAFMENVPGRAWMKDVKGRYVALYPLTARLAFSSGDWSGKTDEELWAPEIAAQYRANDKKVITTRKPLQIIEAYFREGRRGFALVSKFPILDVNGAVALVGGISMDITERKRAEEQLRRSEEQLHALAARLQAVREEEGLRIAREVHDVLGQALTTLNLDVLWLRKKLVREKNQQLRAQFRERIKSMEKLLNSTTRSVHRISSTLRPGILDELGLAATLEWQVEEFERRTHVHCHWKPKPRAVALGRNKTTALFRIFQEILTNVARHAEARSLQLQFRVTNDKLLLQVTDDGKGFDENKISHRKALGLLGMRERSALIGASLEIRSALGKGTSVTVQLPLSAKNQKEASRK